MTTPYVPGTLETDVKKIIMSLQNIAAIVGNMSQIYTVATLPAASANPGIKASVSDANSTTFASVVAGGGANIVPVYSNGTNWIIG